MTKDASQKALESTKFNFNVCPLNEQIIRALFENRLKFVELIQNGGRSVGGQLNSEIKLEHIEELSQPGK